jgi:outer membrane receptor protein involved in Fe transport
MLRYIIQSGLVILLLNSFFIDSVFAQSNAITISGEVREEKTKGALPFVNVILKSAKDSTFIVGTVTDEMGMFTLSNVAPSEYILVTTFVGYKDFKMPLYVGRSSPFLQIPPIELVENEVGLSEVVILGQADDVSGKMDRKTYSVEDNIAQSGGSVLQTMQNLPGVTVQDGKVQLRGSDKIVVLIDGKQTSITGMGSQNGLDNIPASAIEKIEIINNPSAKYDGNGSAGIINIIYKKHEQEGFNAKFGLAGGLGALWVRKENLPDIRPQYHSTPKINPSFSMNYKRKKLNLFAQADYQFTQTLNKNEFVTRTYDDGTIIQQQTKRNRDTQFANSKVGFDYTLNDKNSISFSALFGLEKILDHGDEPFFNSASSERTRLWQFLEDELKTTAMASASYQHKFSQPGRVFNTGLNYTFHREDEKYFFNNILPTSSGKDSFALISDETVFDFNADYTHPFKYGRLESGVKARWREIPTNMQFYPGLNSPLDSTAGGKATYKEIIPAAYSNYVFENRKLEAELGLRLEYVKIQYQVAPGHPVYKSNGYNYSQPFPNARVAYKLNDHNKLSVFFNRRVDRPNEVDIRIFPKYDDAEIIKVGNPALKPQFTTSFEMGYKSTFKKGYLYAAAYHRISDGTITRISTIVPGSTLIYAVFQNAGKSLNTGLEVVFNLDVAKWYSLNVNANFYYNQIDAFAVENLYPVPTYFQIGKQSLNSGNIKLNSTFHFKNGYDIQFTAIYLAPDIIPQGKVSQRFTMNLGVKKIIQKGKGELFINATDLGNTLVVKKEILGNGFKYSSKDYYETQVIRLGYTYKF